MKYFETISTVKEISLDKFQITPANVFNTLPKHFHWNLVGILCLQLWLILIKLGLKLLKSKLVWKHYTLLMVLTLYLESFNFQNIYHTTKFRVFFLFLFWYHIVLKIVRLWCLTGTTSHNLMWLFMWPFHLFVVVTCLFWFCQ